MFIINKANERRSTGHGTFQLNIIIPGIHSGGNDKGFYNLGRFDDARLSPGAFISMHPHQNDEILSFLRKGTMLHKDSTGHLVAIHPQNLMMMNAGSGIYHEESIPKETYSENVEMLQIFIRPQIENLEPKVQFANPGDIVPNHWRLVAGNEASKAPLKINSSIVVYDVEAENSEISLPDSLFTESIFYLYLYDGEMKIKDEVLKQGDSVIVDDLKLQLTIKNRATIIAFVIDKNAQYSRNGMYSGMY